MTVCVFLEGRKSARGMSESFLILSRKRQTHIPSAGLKSVMFNRALGQRGGVYPPLIQFIRILGSMWSLKNDTNIPILHEFV